MGIADGNTDLCNTVSGLHSINATLILSMLLTVYQCCFHYINTAFFLYILLGLLCPRQNLPYNVM